MVGEIGRGGGGGENGGGIEERVTERMFDGNRQIEMLPYRVEVVWTASHTEPFPRERQFSDTAGYLAHTHTHTHTHVHTLSNDSWWRTRHSHLYTHARTHAHTHNIYLNAHARSTYTCTHS